MLLRVIMYGGVKYNVVQINTGRADMRIRNFLMTAVAMVMLAGFTAWDPESVTEEVTVSMVDPDATNETRALFVNMRDLAGDYILFGHQDDLAYGVHWKNEPGRSDVREVTGAYPAVFGWELGDLELGAEENLDAVNFENLKGWIREAYEMGGINTISWHLNNPVTGGDAWDTEGRPVATILPGGENHELFNEWLDRFAEFANDLTVEVDGDEQFIPIIFRPWHEHNGSWFWWGADHCTPEEYNELWRYMVTYLRDEKGLNHLIWAHSPGSFDGMAEFLERYPGDDYVDLVGFDMYNIDQDNYIESMRSLVEYAEERGMIAAFTETGNEALRDETWYTEVLYPLITQDEVARRISYVLVWRNSHEETDRVDHYYTPYPGHPAADDFVRFYEKDEIIFQDRLPYMYSIDDEIQPRIMP